MSQYKRRAKQTGRDADPLRTLSLTGAAWRKLRACVLARDPLCQDCQRRGRVTLATDVDHISGDPSDNRMENLQGLCHACHSRKTAADHGKAVRQGCGLDGWPDAPGHPWNSGQKSPAAKRY